jgi:hypothetical protein
MTTAHRKDDEHPHNQQPLSLTDNVSLRSHHGRWPVQNSEYRDEFLGRINWELNWWMTLHSDLNTKRVHTRVPKRSKIGDWHSSLHFAESVCLSRTSLCQSQPLTGWPSQAVLQQHIACPRQQPNTALASDRRWSPTVIDHGLADVSALPEVTANGSHGNESWYGRPRSAFIVQL